MGFFRSLLSCEVLVQARRIYSVCAAIHRPLREYLEIPIMRLSTLVHHIVPFVALGGGILVMIKPQLLNFVVAAYLILTGIVGLNGLYHFMR
jgi:hypothetical protein